MKARNFQIILSIALLFICSMLSSMAQTCHCEEVPTEIVESSAVNGEQDEQTVQLIDQFAVLPEFVSAEQAEISVDSEEEDDSEHFKRLAKYGRSSKFHFSSTFFANRASKGVAKHPGTQDSLEQRTAMIRFLQKAALI